MKKQVVLKLLPFMLLSFCGFIFQSGSVGAEGRFWSAFSFFQVILVLTASSL